MGLYDGIKDVANIIQKANNIELYGKLLDLSAQALELQNNNTKLIEENIKLKKKQDLLGKIIRHKETYITLEDDKNEIMYCSCCWDSTNKLIQVRMYDDGEYVCHICKNQGCFDKEMYKKRIEDIGDNIII